MVGKCEQSVFGLRPAERLDRQLSQAVDLTVVADASSVLDDAALGWLIAHPGTIIASRSGRRLAVAVQPCQVKAAARSLGRASALPVVFLEDEQFVRKLRRRVPLGAYSLRDEPARAIEKHLFDNAYKGVTDAVTKWAWPWPAFHVTRACASLGITPNMVTIAGIAMVFVAAWFFYQGQLVAGLAAAWLMTFLDTVDGKLARVTNTSSPLGNLLDHGTDVIHPPVWWYCLAHGIAATGTPGASLVWPAFWVILGCYIVGRAVELAFHRFFGFNQYIWRPFDSLFRLVISRRNIILLIMTAGLAVGEPTGAFILCAAWSIVSTHIQALRIGQAFAGRPRAPVKSWLT